MMTPPIRRVETPQLVVLQSVSVPASSWNLIFCASAKCVPRKCDVPACSALPSCIIASMDQVATAPGKRSFSGFSPAITGMANMSSAKAR